MAAEDPILPVPTSIDLIESDYGSDLDDATLDEIFSQSQSESAAVIPSIEEPVLPQDDIEGLPSSQRLARIRENLVRAIVGLNGSAATLTSNDPSCTRSLEVEHDSSNRGSFTPIKPETRRESTPVLESPTPDTRSPIERFRSRKPLSVTDIVTPAWCELQYSYSLSKYGRVRRTAAMKAGSKIHKEKEREVYTEVHVEIATKEDQFGLRLWNIIQGLRTLRATGLTRELEVLGLVEGEVIVGIIDELSFDRPDEEMEREILGKGKETVPTDQRIMDQFFARPSSVAVSQPQTIYLVDIKTRRSKGIPELGSQMRATQMQLMMYRRLLQDLAANKVEAERIFSRYAVDADRPFSDTFMAQLANLDLSNTPFEMDDANDEPRITIIDDPLEEILSHNTLASLWSHMISEFAKTIPSSTSISPLLTAEFRSSENGALIGQRKFPFSDVELDAYVASVMRWWRGEREPVGVEIEEVYKCKSCDFLDSCTWRAAKQAELHEKARSKRGGNGKGARVSIGTPRSTI